MMPVVHRVWTLRRPAGVALKAGNLHGVMRE